MCTQEEEEEQQQQQQQQQQSSRAAKMIMLRLKLTRVLYDRKAQQQGRRKPDPVRTHFEETGPPRNSSYKRASVK
jgi:hypothetical protein